MNVFADSLCPFHTTSEEFGNAAITVIWRKLGQVTKESDMILVISFSSKIHVRTLLNSAQMIVQKKMIISLEKKRLK